MKRSAILLVPAFTLLSASLLAACGGEPRTTAQGHVLVNTGTAMTGFELPSEVRIDDMEASTDGRLFGSCEIRQVLADEGDEFSVRLDLSRGGDIGDEGLGRISITQRTDARPEDGMVDLTLGATEFSSGDAGCEIRVDYAVSRPSTLSMKIGRS